ncbi:hypothetical protein SporoP17a_02575 [Sporosarcina ureae]|nr:hypothetical protein SporoP17a_02575 [Sporosarcina ureae]
MKSVELSKIKSAVNVEELTFTALFYCDGYVSLYYLKFVRLDREALTERLSQNPAQQNTVAMRQSSFFLIPI